MIEKYLDLSTGHVSKETAEWLDENPKDLIMYPKGEYGWIVYAMQEELKSYNYPKDLVKVIKYAKKNGCVWIMFDRDGDQVDKLKLYNW